MSADRPQYFFRTSARALPSLVILSLAVRYKIVLGLEPICAFDAVVLPQAGKIFGVLGVLEVLKVFAGGEVLTDLIIVSVVNGNQL